MMLQDDQIISSQEVQFRARSGDVRQIMSGVAAAYRTRTGGDQWETAISSPHFSSSWPSPEYYSQAQRIAALLIGSSFVPRTTPDAGPGLLDGVLEASTQIIEEAGHAIRANQWPFALGLIAVAAILIFR